MAKLEVTLCVRMPFRAARLGDCAAYLHRTRNREVGICLNTTKWRLLHLDVEMSTEHDEFFEKNSKFINRVLSYGDSQYNASLNMLNTSFYLGTHEVVSRTCS
jgi:hypothetical protein